MEPQSRALVLARVIGTEALKGSLVKVKKLKEELVESTNSLKVILEATSFLEERA